MKIFLRSFFVLAFSSTLLLNTVNASCVTAFEHKKYQNIKRDGMLGTFGAAASFVSLIPLLGPYALIPVGVSAAWVYKDLYLPSSATKMTQLIFGSYLVNRYVDLVDLKEVIKATEKNSKAVKRLNKIVTKTTKLRPADGKRFLKVRSEIAIILLEANNSRALCRRKLMKYRKVDDFLKIKLKKMSSN